MKSAIALLALALAIAQPAFAEVWKCTAANGRIEFQDRPCANGATVAINPNVISGPDSGSDTARKAAELTQRIKARDQQIDSDRLAQAKFVAACQQRYDAIYRARPYLRAKELADRQAAAVEIKLQTRDAIDMGCAAP